MSVSVILLAGGSGQRMQSALPKQYLSLMGKEIVRYSLEYFQDSPLVAEIVVVCEEAQQPLFKELTGPTPLRFALPGKRRQDSVYHGLAQVALHENLVCVHDGARPFPPPLDPLITAAKEHGAAVFGIKLPFTVKEGDDKARVVRTLLRSRLWEIQTPQVARYDWLCRGFQQVHQTGVTVTDDVSLIEMLGLPVQIVPGDPHNFKITYPSDLAYAEFLLTQRGIHA
jgi:2-C-methyl-D-erythritol 4-phosphate cytidylyltransferase